MFGVTKVQAKIRAVTIVNEKHGQEEVPSLSLSLMMALQASSLDGLAKGFRQTLFRTPVKEEKSQESLEGMEANDGATKVLFPNLGPLNWNEDFTGYKLTIGSGLTSTDTEKVIENVKLSKIKIEPKDGGSIVLTCSVHFEADETLIGAFGASQGKMVELSLEPPYLSDLFPMLKLRNMPFEHQP